MLNTIKKFEELGYNVVFMLNEFYIAKVDTEKFVRVGTMKEVKIRCNELILFKSMRLN